MIDLSNVVNSDPDILAGTPVFRGTRVPVRISIEFLAAGDSLEKFLDAYPSVARDQAVAFLESAGELAATHARPA